MTTKKLKCKVLVEFKDLKEDTYRNVGDVFEVTKTRLAEINKKSNEAIGKDIVAETNDAI